MVWDTAFLLLPAGMRQSILPHGTKPRLERLGQKGPRDSTNVIKRQDGFDLFNLEGLVVHAESSAALAPMAKPAGKITLPRK